ncbi:NACHT, LRR and PYD domains-containing protein 12-like [Chanos chanos]|uniref:NACHT, LRR and PYD domains-containing protein 12-like n=1 Tax=Chanos chanos TaxID=29144 RepID=A0A6J2VWK1_CHACN|nr:NACHT, LRR and PYD domains-containing protein 12-like [Chanos chanos]
MQTVRENKTILADILSADIGFVLQHAQQRELITDREYRNLNVPSHTREQISISLLDILMSKCDKTCQKFISLLREPDILRTFPRLEDLFPAHPVDLKQDDCLQLVCKKLKTRLKSKFGKVFEGIAKRGHPSLLDKIYTELCITEGESEVVNEEHEIWKIDKESQATRRQDRPVGLSDIFTHMEKPEGERTEIRTVLTMGIAGIGKTVSLQKFTLDWAEGKANQDIDFVFVLPFRELNKVRDDHWSLHELLLYFYPEIKEMKGTEFYEYCKIAFIFDGFDESKLPMDFDGNRIVSEMTKPASLDVLMTNLICGNLLHSALIWITSRPAAIKKIPPEQIHRVTEVRGFSDSQKEEYIKKRVSDQSMASEIIKQMKSSRSLQIMCHIPVFCWIMTTVCEYMLGKSRRDKIPLTETRLTLTEMYTRWMLTQTVLKNEKYFGERARNAVKMTEQDVQIIHKLGELAFRNLQESNLVFSERDLEDHGIDACVASVQSGIFTEIFRQEDPMFNEEWYSFVHLSFQEYLAAVHVLNFYVSYRQIPPQLNRSPSEGKVSSVWLLAPADSLSLLDLADVEEDFRAPDFSGAGTPGTLHDLHRAAVDCALESDNGHLDLFLRFLLGLSLEANHKLLKQFLMETERDQDSVQRTICYIKYRLRDKKRLLSPERCVNLLHCLAELNDNSLNEEIQRFMSGENLRKQRPSAGECSALAYMMQMSEEPHDELDLRKFNTSGEGKRRLIPAMKNCRKAVIRVRLSPDTFELLVNQLQPDAQLRKLDLSYSSLADTGVEKIFLQLGCCELETLRLICCLLTEKSCATLASVLPDSHLKELDLSCNGIGEEGVKLLCDGFLSPRCQIQSLRLRECHLSVKACDCLAPVLFTHSVLKELDLSSNDLQDAGVKLLSAGLENPHCVLQKLGLSGCLVTEEGCSSLASALSSNPSHLRELDLSYNHPGDSGVKLLSAKLEDPRCKLETLKLDCCGESRLRPQLKKYAHDLGVSEFKSQESIDQWEEECVRTDHPGLSDGRFYWQFEWTGIVEIGMRYWKNKGRFQEFWTAYSYDSGSTLGRSLPAESLLINNAKIKCGEIGMFLDHPEGTLSFYEVSSDNSLNYIHTFFIEDREPLFPRFAVLGPGSIRIQSP